MNTDELTRIVYPELRRVASLLLNGERSNHTLQPTALVHEVYLRLAAQDQATWNDRTHFKAVAAMIMRRILVDHALARGAQKRGGDRKRVTLSITSVNETLGIDTVELDEALTRLSELDERQARIVAYRFFGGLTMSEISEYLGISERTAHREWTSARAWLCAELSEDEPDGS